MRIFTKNLPQDCEIDYFNLDNSRDKKRMAGCCLLI